MRVVPTLCALLVAGTAYATPGDVHDKFRQASQLAASEENEKAIVLIREGLAIAPKDLELLQLEGRVLLKMRDYDGSLEAYQAYLAAGATGANRRTALRIVASLEVVKATSVDITVANGPASIYFDNKSAGLFCTAAPVCKKGVLPGDYKVIAEREGFERWTGKISVEPTQSAQLTITLVEKPSELTVHVVQPEATVTIDGAPVTGPVTLPGGDHQVVVALAHFASEHRTIAAHEGKPVAIEISLVPQTMITTSVPAQLALDGAKLVLDQGLATVPPGEHTIVAHADGFRDARVTIPAERAADYAVALVLEPLGARLDVAGVPAGASVVIDGKAVATTPLAAPLEVVAGMHDLEVRVPGFLPYHDRRAYPTNEPVHVRISHLRAAGKRHTIIAASGTGVMAVLGGVTGFIALDHKSQFETRAALPSVASTDPQLASLQSSGHTYELASDVGFGLAIAGAVLTTYLWRHEGRGESEGSVHIGIGVGTAMLSGRF